MKRFLPSLITAAAIVATLGTAAVAATPASITIPMKALNGSGEKGTAVLTQRADGVQVVVHLTGAPAYAQPTHIHIGTCGNINKAPEYALANTVNGTSVSTVKGIKLADLMKMHYAINVHKSANNLGMYVSCGNIKA